MPNTIIRIKRSGTTGSPASLKTAELAYSYLAGTLTSGGDRLYIGTGDDGSGTATSIAVIGGKYFMDMLDHAPGTVTANSAVIVDANRTIDYLKIDNVEIDGNAVKATSGDLNVTAIGSITINGAYSLPKADSTAGYVLTTNGTGTVTFQPSAATLNLSGDSTVGAVALLTSNLRVFGGEGIDTAVSGNTITISAEDASDTNKGVASFGTRDFSVTSGSVLLSNTVVATSNTTLGSVGAVDSVKSYQFTFNPQGRIVGSLTWSDIPLSYTYNADSGTAVKVVTGANVTFTGGEGIDTTVSSSGNTITIAAELASYNNKGVAEFNADSFTVTSGNVELKTVNSNIGAYGSATNVPVVTVDAKGRVTAISTASISTNFTIAAETGTSQVFNNGNTLLFAAGEGIDTAVSGNTITISGEDASSTNKGIAAFNSGEFTVTAGNVRLANVNSAFGVFGGSSATQIIVPVITVDGYGRTTVSSNLAIGTSFTLAGDTGTSSVNLANTLIFKGVAAQGISTAATSNTITITAANASTTQKGVASFNTNNFTVTDGVVSTKVVTIGTTTVNSGATTTVLAGLTQLDVDNIRIDGNTISSTDGNGDLILSPNGTGGISVENSRIKSVLDPIDLQDAATKKYVDELAQGLHIKPAVKAATTGNLIATYDNANAGVGATLTLSPAATLNIDGVTSWSQYDGILVKNQTNKAHNGRYFISQVGNVSTSWILTRCSACDEPDEIPSAYVFVQEGTLYASSGWVAIVENFSTFTVGTDDITWTQFSGAGTYTAGDGLDLTGTSFSVKVASTGGLEIVDDELRLKSSLAGNGLVFTGNIFNVVGTTNRITVAADSIDIASTYVGQSSITTLGTITTGTWTADTIAASRGGTGHTSYANYDILYGVSPNTLAKLSMGAAGTVLQANATTGALEWNMIDGGLY